MNKLQQDCSEKYEQINFKTALWNKGWQTKLLQATAHDDVLHLLKPFPSKVKKNKIQGTLNTRQMLSHNNTGNSSSSPQMFYLNTVFLQVFGAGAAVTPAFILHRPFLFHLFVSAPLLHCVIKPACDWNASSQTAAGFPGSAFPSCYLHPVWFLVAARDSRGQDCTSISDWISACLLSVIFRLLGKPSGSAARVSSDALIRQTGSPLDPTADGFLSDKRPIKPPSFPFSAPDH